MIVNLLTTASLLTTVALLTATPVLAMDDSQYSSTSVRAQTTSTSAALPEVLAVEHIEALLLNGYLQTPDGNFELSKEPGGWSGSCGRDDSSDKPLPILAKLLKQLRSKEPLHKSPLPEQLTIEHIEDIMCLRPFGIAGKELSFKCSVNCSDINAFRQWLKRFRAKGVPSFQRYFSYITPDNFSKIQDKKKGKTIFFRRYQNTFPEDGECVNVHYVFDPSSQSHASTPEQIEQLLESALRPDDRMQINLLSSNTSDGDSEIRFLGKENRSGKVLYYYQDEKCAWKDLKISFKKMPFQELPEFTVYKIPAHFKDYPSAPFYAEHDPITGFYVGIERVTADNCSFWTQRLGAEATIHWHAVHNAPPPAPVLYAFDGLCPSEDPEAARYRKEEEKYMALAPSCLDDPSFREAVTAYPSTGGAPGTKHQHDVSFHDALRAFENNLSRYGTDPTFVSYVSSEPITGRLCDTRVPVTSPALKSFMTATVDGPFYTPVGIHRSKIAKHFDAAAPLCNISERHHAWTALLMQKMDPKIGYLVVRPLAEMGKKLEQMGVPFVKSSGYLNKELPSIVRKMDGSEGIPFGDTNYVFVDPPRREIHQIPTDHHFSTSPFIGDADELKLQAFPFVTISCDALVSTLNSPDKERSSQ